MKETFLKVAREGHFFHQHRKVLVAVSGGRDSMSLLQVLYDCRDELDIELGIAHVHHGQRKASDEEEAYLKRLAKELFLPIYISHFQGKFSEKNAREFRYNFFESLMEEEGYTAVVTAHHRQDQAETVFMRLVRGSRLVDMRAMQAVQEFGSGQLIRPFLSFSKEELVADVYFEDESNHQPTYFRNRIRNQYLPMLAKENPQIETALISLSQEAAILREAFVQLTNSIAIGDTQQFQAQSPAVQHVLLQQYLEQFPTLQISKQQFAELLAILRKKQSYHHALKNGYYLQKDADHFAIHRFRPETDDAIEPLVLHYGDSLEIEGCRVSFGKEIAGASQILVVAKDRPVILRSRKAGDTLLLNGHHKKVRRYFIDKKVPKEQRNKALIIEQSGQIYGIAKMVTTDLSKSDKHDIMKAIFYIT